MRFDGEQVEPLENHRHSRANIVDRTILRINPLAFNQNIATLIGFQPVQATQHRGLSRTGGTYEADHFTLLHISADAFENLKRTIGFGHVLYFNHRHDQCPFLLPKSFSRRPTAIISGKLRQR